MKPDSAISLDQRLAALIRGWWWAAAGTALALLCGYAIDLPLARWIHTGSLPGDLRKIVNLAEVFAHGYGVALILITAATLDARGPRILPRLAICAYGAGLAASLSKVWIERFRPRSFLELLQHEPGRTTTFGDWLPLVTNGWRGATNHAAQSLPSGHTATAVGLAIGLTYFYPRGRWLFFALATLAGLQRIAHEVHYASDVVAGATLGGVLAVWLAGASDSRLHAWLESLENGGRRTSLINSGAADTLNEAGGALEARRTSDVDADDCGGDLRRAC